LVGPYLHELAPYKSLILTVGGVAWAVAAWMLAPPPALVDADEDEVDGPEVDAATADIDEDQAEREAPVDPEPAPAPQRTRGELLAQHVLEVLADTEAKGGSGVHVVALLASAESAGLLAPGVTDKAALRQWLDASQIPVTKSVKVGGKVDYGVRVERVAEALGMPPREALARLLGGGPKAPAENPVQAPAPAHAETPHTVPLPASAGAADGAAQSGRLALVKTLPEGAAQGSAQGAA
ncbi:MAG: hypothetical protein LBV60_24270, partial [Streptomyces sp.]|nr:hypothetical protein [Streptomyces sp.]